VKKNGGNVRLTITAYSILALGVTILACLRGGLEMGILSVVLHAAVGILILRLTFLAEECGATFLCASSVAAWYADNGLMVCFTLAMGCLFCSAYWVMDARRKH